MATGLELKKIRLKEQKKLNEKNLILYKRITSYIKNTVLTFREKEEVLQQIMDMMLQAQIEGKSVDIVLGSDYEEFCNSIVEEFYNSRSGVFNFFNYMQKYFATTVVILSVFLLVNTMQGSAFITIGDFLNAGVLSIIVFPIFSVSREKRIVAPIHNKIKFNINLSIESMQKPVICMLSAFLIIRLIIMNTVGSEILSCKLYLYRSLIYMITILFIVAVIELYKMRYEKSC